MKPESAEKEPQPVAVPEALPEVPVKSDADSKASDDAPVVKNESKAAEKLTDKETDTYLETPLKLTHVKLMFVMATVAGGDGQKACRSTHFEKRGPFYKTFFLYIFL